MTRGKPLLGSVLALALVLQVGCARVIRKGTYTKSVPGGSKQVSGRDYARWDWSGSVRRSRRGDYVASISARPEAVCTVRRIKTTYRRKYREYRAPQNQGNAALGGGLVVGGLLMTELGIQSIRNRANPDTTSFLVQGGAVAMVVGSAALVIAAIQGLRAIDRVEYESASTHQSVLSSRGCGKGGSVRTDVQLELGKLRGVIRRANVNKLTANLWSCQKVAAAGIRPTQKLRVELGDPADHFTGVRSTRTTYLTISASKYIESCNQLHRTLAVKHLRSANSTRRVDEWLKRYGDGRFPDLTRIAKSRHQSYRLVGLRGNIAGIMRFLDSCGNDGCDASIRSKATRLAIDALSAGDLHQWLKPLMLKADAAQFARLERRLNGMPRSLRSIADLKLLHEATSVSFPAVASACRTRARALEKKTLRVLAATKMYFRRIQVEVDRAVAMHVSSFKLRFVPCSLREGQLRFGVEVYDNNVHGPQMAVGIMTRILANEMAKHVARDLIRLRGVRGVGMVRRLRCKPMWYLRP